MTHSTTEAIQQMILYSTAAKSDIRTCFSLMKDKKFSQVEKKLQDITELLQQTRALEKSLLTQSVTEDETIDEARLLYASTHLLATSVLFETAVEMKNLYQLGFSS